jgi:SAM-dependent methyltransferase
MVCPVWLYPVDGFIVASDRRDNPDGEPLVPSEDVVFPAIYAGTLRFLRLLPDARGGDVLDLCGGTGIGALRSSRAARYAATADVTPRSAFFAEFNARLNGSSVASLCGDLYSPVAGRQFDLISAHPPFVPATGPAMVYRDGGESGEEITRRIIEGLPAHLRAGGTCVILCVARDTVDQTFENRAREWLGQAGTEFDIVFGLEKILSVEEVVDSMRKRGQQIGEEQSRQLLERLRSLGTRQFVYGALFLQRCAEAATDQPLRMNLTVDGRAEDFERLLAWRRHCRQPGFDACLATARPRLAPQLELTARHRVNAGQLVPAEFVFSIVNGFQAALRPDAWVVPLVARLEGDRSVGQVFAAAQAADELPPGFTLEAFGGLVRKMIERGFLEVDLPPGIE